MPRRRENLNPFDREKPSKNNPIEIAIHTEFFSENYLRYRNELMKLVDISKLPFVNVTFLPARNLNPELKILFRNREIPICYYADTSVYQEKIVLRYDEVEMGILNGNLNKWGEVCFDNSQVKVLDSQALIHLVPDYFVLSGEDYFYKERETSFKKVTIYEILQELRILLVHYGIFYQTPYSKIVGDEPYYSYRVDKKFPQFVKSNLIWSYIGDSSPSITHSNFSSLAQRLYMISKALDKIDFHSLKKPNNDTLDECLYHLGYLIMLVTGAFDGVAWIIKEFYNFNLRKERVSILVPMQKQKTDFTKMLNECNTQLYDYLVNEETKTKINIIYQIRHSLQHRAYIQGMGQIISENKGPNLLYLPNDSNDLFNVLSDDLSSVWGLNHDMGEGKLFELRVFTHRIFEITCEIINTTLSLIEWDNQIVQLDHDIREELRKKLETLVYSKIGSGLTSDSLYFD
jgi:hypothetical protein